MSDTTNLPDLSPERPSVSEALTTLQLQFQATLIILIMLSGAINLYLYRQYNTLRKEAIVLEPQVEQMNEGYERTTVPLRNKFLSLLMDYTKAHPDFQPIMDKYKVQAVPASTAPSAAQPAPLPPPAQPATPAKAPAKTPTATAPATKK